MELGELVSLYRRQAGITIDELVEKSGVPKGTITKIIGGVTKTPTLENMKAIAKALNKRLADFDDEPEIENFLSDTEHKIIEKYRNLDPYGQETVNMILDREIARIVELRNIQQCNDELKAEPQKASIPKRIFAYYGKIAAAGIGVGFSDMIAGTKEYYLTDDNKSADYTIGVSGNSMEKTYYDGDIVFVKKQNHINIGDIGIFQKDNLIYIKEAGENGLFSHNPNYDPIIDESEVICLGKVLCKVTDDMIVED